MSVAEEPQQVSPPGVSPPPSPSSLFPSGQPADKQLRDIGWGNVDDDQPPALTADDGPSSPAPPVDPRLSATAPAWQPQRHVPHSVSVFNPGDYGTATLRCNLAAVSIAELRSFAAKQFPGTSSSCDILLNGQPLSTDPGALLIDAGLSNGCVVVLRAKQAGADGGQPSPPPLPDAEAPAAAPPAPAAHPPAALPTGAGIPPMPMLPLPFPGSAPLPAAFPGAAGSFGAAAASWPLQQPTVGVVLPPPRGSGLSTPSPCPPPLTPAQLAQQQLAQTQLAQQLAALQVQQPMAVAPGLEPVSLSPPPRPASRSSSSSPCDSVGPTLSSAASSAGGAAGAQHMVDNFVSFATTSEGSRHLMAAIRAVPEPHTDETVAAFVRAARVTLPQRGSAHRDGGGLLAAHQHAAKVVALLATVASPAQAAGLLCAVLPLITELAETNTGSETCVALINAAPIGHPDLRNPANGRSLVVEPLLLAVPRLCVIVSGRKLLQAVVAKMPAADVAPLYTRVGGNLLDIATDQCGCITVQRLCDAAPSAELRDQLYAQLMDAAVHLLTDPYGNYALQHAVKESPACSAVISQVVAPRVVDLATNKFASNVIERCLSTGPESARHTIIPLIVAPAALDVLMHDAFGNYVVQSCIDNAPSTLVDMLKENITPRVARSPYGYRIDSKLQRRASGRRAPHAGHRRGPAEHARADEAKGGQARGGYAPPKPPPHAMGQPLPHAAAAALGQAAMGRGLGVPLQPLLSQQQQHAQLQQCAAESSSKLLSSKPPKGVQKLAQQLPATAGWGPGVPQLPAPAPTPAQGSWRLMGPHPPQMTGQALFPPQECVMSQAP